ncbi:MAG: DUF975 family protein [Bacteroidales bacterium]|nr:DUF975 family protein [Bacteroidales bacterium]
MMPENKEIRAIARGELKGNWTQPVLCTLVYLLVGAGIAVIPFVGSIAALLVTVPLSFGFILTFLGFMRNQNRDEMVGQPFKVFNEYGRYLGGSLLVSIFTILWALLLIIPGIIKAYAYAMTPYIMKDQPELSAVDCIDRSMSMMNGYKWKLFLLDLSFIGWWLLSILTLGIGMLWLNPYVYCSRAKFYEELKQRN